MGSPKTTKYSEMQGFAAASLTDRVTPFSSPSSQISQVRDPIVGSLHSEPDIDTIMPLPGSSRMSFRSGRRSPVRTGPHSFLLSGESGGGGMEDSDEDEEWRQHSGGLQHSGSQPREYGSGGFTNVEVCTVFKRHTHNHVK